MTSVEDGQKSFNKILNSKQVMKTLRILFFAFSALLFAGSVVTLSKAIQHDNTELSVNAVGLMLLSLSAPAIASRNFLTALSFMGLSRAEEHLINYLNTQGRVDAQTLSNYLSGKLRLIAAQFYIRYKITGLNGIQPIFNQLSAKATGITNLDKAILPKGVNAVISRILIGYITHATETDPKVLAAYSSDVGGFPAGLRNGHIVIKQDGVILQDPIPVSLCGSQADTTAAQGRVDSLELETPIILEEGKQIEIEIDFPVASFAANQHHIEMFLLGSKTRVRSLS